MLDQDGATGVGVAPAQVDLQIAGGVVFAGRLSVIT
jgi:hypothetical protein